MRMIPVKKFKSDRIICLEGRGLVFTINIQKDSDIPKTDEIIVLNGKQCVCMGIESFAGMVRKPEIGILFKYIGDSVNV